MTNKDRIKLFDTWANHYDETVISADDYPFDGYERVLDRIVELANPKANFKVLDLGTGTGNLAKRFMDKEATVWGLDYSKKMLEEAKKKYPQLEMIEADIMGDWMGGVGEKFDCIVSAYVFHEFDLDGKLDLIQRLTDNLLVENGYLIVGDVAFPTQQNLDYVRKLSGEKWDGDEFYWVAHEAISQCKSLGFRAEYEQISSCGGVFIIRK